MTCKSIAATLFAAVLLGAAHRAPLLSYSAPAGNRPAGADAVHPTTAILPNGRIASPAGASTYVGSNPLGMTLTPNGRFAIVSNDEARAGGPAQPGAPVAGSSLAVVDTATMKLASTYADPSSAFFLGVAAARDPNDRNGAIVLASDAVHGVVRAFTLSPEGLLQPLGAPIVLPATAGRPAFPAGIAFSPDGATAYVVDRLGDSISTIDVAARTVTRTQPVGDFPLAVAAAGARVLVSGGGLGAYRETAPAALPPFAAPPFDPARSSSLAVFDAGASADPATLLMDPAPDGTRIVGGAAPDAIVLRRDGKLAYVALANVDRVAVVSLAGANPRVTRGLDLRLYPDAPYGAQPSAEALSKDGKRLYVALAGLNAVAVLDARAPARYRFGLIPTAWYPTALALSPNGRYLYVTAAKGVDGWGMLTRIDLKHTSLMKATMETLRYNRTAKVAKPDAIVPPLRSGKRSSAIDRVIYIAVGIDGYDAMLGDLTDAAGAPHGNGDATLVRYPRDATPNLHALAQTYALADNFYAPDADLAVSRSIALNADATLYEQLLARVAPADAGFEGPDDPEDYPRDGLLFNALARAGLAFRDYGGALQLSGYRDGLYHLDVPAPAVLSGSADTAYPGADSRAGDAQRAAEFVADMKRYTDASQMPSFTYVWLPTRATGDGVREADRALGTIVDFLTHAPQWASTAIFIVPEGVARGRDHVNALRSYCVVVSPYAKRGYVGRAHLSVPSVVKTEEEIFGLPPLALADLLASDMAGFFTATPDPSPYDALR